MLKSKIPSFPHRAFVSTTYPDSPNCRSSVGSTGITNVHGVGNRAGMTSIADTGEVPLGRKSINTIPSSWQMRKLPDPRNHKGFVLGRYFLQFCTRSAVFVTSISWLWRASRPYATASSSAAELKIPAWFWHVAVNEYVCSTDRKSLI